MEIAQIKDVHDKLLQVYKTHLLPVVDKYFNNQENKAHEKTGGEFDTTLVTEADLAINKVLYAKLPELVTGASIISEEGKDITVAKHTFIIDPIDGTHTFARNLDDWGISIELCEDGEVIYSIIFYPNCKTEYYYAIKDLGAFDSNNNKLTAKPFFKFKPNFVCAPSFGKIGRALINFTEGKHMSFKIYGSVVYAAYTLYRGGSDLIVFDNLNIWDILGCVFIAEVSGFKVKWFGEVPRLNDINDLKKLHTLTIYKPDYDKKLLGEMLNVIKAEYKGF